eukprot:936483-Alexandrium_andersonii.AAC.1
MWEAANGSGGAWGGSEAEVVWLWSVLKKSRQHQGAGGARSLELRMHCSGASRRRTRSWTEGGRRALGSDAGEEDPGGRN